MLLVALDTALGAASAAILDVETDRVLAAVSEPMARGHAERLLPIVHRALDMAGVHARDCRRFVTTVGPGSFTGLRVAIAAARGMALAANGEAVGVSTLAALAAPHLAASDAVPVAAVIDARHDHVYLALINPAGNALIAPSYWPIREAARAIATSPVTVAGPGAEALLAAWPKDAPPPLLTDAAAFPDIAVVARLGAVADPLTARARPLYLKEVDARPQAPRPGRPAA